MSVHVNSTVHVLYPSTNEIAVLVGWTVIVHSGFSESEHVAVYVVSVDIVIDDGDHVQLLYPPEHVIIGAVKVQFSSLFHIVHESEFDDIDDTVLSYPNVPVTVLEKIG